MDSYNRKRRRNRRLSTFIFALALALLLLVIFSVQLFPLGTGTKQGNSSHASTESAQTQLLAPVTGPSAVVMVEEQISSHYSLFNLNVGEHVIGNMTISSLNLNSTLSIDLVTSFSPSRISVLDTLSNGTTLSLPVSIQKGVYAAYIGYAFTLPQSSSNLTMTMQGTQGGEGFLFRQVTYVPFIQVFGLSNISTVYDTFIAVGAHSLIASAFTYGGPGGPGGNPVSVQKTGLSGGGYDYYTVPSDANTLVVQSVYYLPISVAIFILAVFLIILSLLGFAPNIERRLQRVFQGFVARLHGRLIQPITLILTKAKSKIRTKSSSTFAFNGGSKAGAVPKHKMRRFFKRYVQSKNLLVLFILCGVLMAALAAAAGPAPQLKAYVIADPPVANQIQANLQSITGGNVQVITPAQDYSDFQVMSSVGTFNLLVLSSYSNFTIGEVASYVSPGLGNVPLIVIDNNSNPALAAQIRSTYPQNVIIVKNAASLNSTEESELINRINCCAKSSPNALGLQISARDFTAILAIEGALSLIIVYLGWAFLAAKAIEPTTENTLTHMVLVVALGVFVFFFSEMSYVVTSTILRYPISLHAVISGASNLTATAILGSSLHLPFGGGSTPRDLAAVLGIFVGALGSGWETQFSKKSLAFFIGMGLLLYLNPLVIGQYVFEAILLFVGNVYLGPVTSNLYSFKGFLYAVGEGLGGGVTPVYLLSAGKILYFAGLIPLAFIKRMGKSTATLTLIVAAIILGHGGLRVGEMTPDKTIIAVVPGLAAGFGFGLIFLLIALFERYLSAHYSSMKL